MGTGARLPEHQELFYLAGTDYVGATLDLDDLSVYHPIGKRPARFFQDPAKGLLGYPHMPGCFPLVITHKIGQPYRLELIGSHFYFIRPAWPAPWAKKADPGIPGDYPVFPWPAACAHFVLIYPDLLTFNALVIMSTY